MSGIKSNVMAEVERQYENYGSRVKELCAEGKKAIGYLCSFVPLEFITAAGCIPFRIRGDIHEPVTKGDSLLETIVCPFIRSCFDLCVKDRYDYLSGIVIPHGCDSMVRSYSVWSYSLNFPYFHFINTPSVVKESSHEFFKEELQSYRKGLEAFTGKTISDEDLREAIGLHNENREKTKALYEFRKSDPPMLSARELHKIVTVGASLPVTEANALFDEVLAELGRRTEAPVKKGPRILLDGPCVDHLSIADIVEESGGNVVIDTTCMGTRDLWPLADEDGDPVASLARRYLDKLNCPKTYRDNTAGTFAGDAADRFDDIGARAKDFAVDGAVLYLYKFCDPFGFEVPARKAYYESLDIPLLCLEDTYSAGTIGQLKTRIQAFLEMIG